jgi:hypothetical protein
MPDLHVRPATESYMGAEATISSGLSTTNQHAEYQEHLHYIPVDAIT